MEEVKTEVKEERTPISAEVLEEVLLRFFGSYLVIQQILQIFSIIGIDGGANLYFKSWGFLISAAVHIAAGIFLIVTPGIWISFTRVLKKFF